MVKADKILKGGTFYCGRDLDNDDARIRINVGRNLFEDMDTFKNTRLKPRKKTKACTGLFT